MDYSLTYYAALQLLPGNYGRLESAMNKITAVGQAAWAAGAFTAADDAAAVASLQGLRDAIIEAGRQVIQEIPQWRAGLSRITRSERLTAAHAVIAVSSYFEIFLRADLSSPLAQLSWNSSEKAALANEGRLPDEYAEIIHLLMREPLPLPEPHRSYPEVRDQLSDLYARLSGKLLRFAASMAAWGELDDAAKDSFAQAVTRVPVPALGQYDDRFRLLTADSKEFGFWAGLAQAPADTTGLSGMPALLAEVAIRRSGQRTRMPLAMSYYAALAEPIIGSGQAPDGVILPPLGEAYVNPVCKAAEIGPADRPEEAEWWEPRNAVPHVDVFLAAYLTSLRAAALPLVVLGEPGSGKSKLAEVLAARLPEQDFLPVLVQLRDVAAESMIQEQIEQAITRGPGSHSSWHELLESAAGALPVVLLDGLDELIQATALNRYDYLEQVRDFQLRQAQAGQPVAVIVTSRTMVAELVRFPRGSLALQLQPFTETQVRRWLEIWGRYNAGVLAERGLKPLPASTALSHRELTEQPLLLLLVTIFDSAHNSLQRHGNRLGRAELYERLLTEFALREITKTARHRTLPEDKQRRLAAAEVRRLAVVALAMFARGQQTATEAELNQDLPVLFTGEDEPRGDPHAELTPAQRATGRFFFIHKSEARLHDDRARSYEFLHATFGEFLVARLAVDALRDVAAYREFSRRGMTAAGQVDDGFLYAVLSFSWLVSRTPITGFMKELLLQLPDDERGRCQEILRELIAESLFPRVNRSYQHYEPVHHTITRRLACYSVNLVVMLVLLSGDVSASEFCGSADTGKKWAQYSYLWRSACTSSEWRNLTDLIRIQASRRDGAVEIVLTEENAAPVSLTDGIILTGMSGGLTEFDIHISDWEDISHEVKIPLSTIAGRAFRDIAFTPNWHVAMLLLHTVPYLRAAGGELRYQLPDGTLALPGYMLAYLDHIGQETPDARCELYGSLATALAASPELTQQLLLRLQREMADFPVSSILHVLSKVNTHTPTQTYMKIINSVWDRGMPETDRSAMVESVSNLRLPWSSEALAMLSDELRRLTTASRLTEEGEE